MQNYKQRIELIRTEMNRLETRFQELEKQASGSAFIYNFPKQTGAIRRASLDLSRALVKLRRPYYESD